MTKKQIVKEILHHEEVIKKKPWKQRKNKMQKEALKMFVFQKQAFGWSYKQLAEYTWYSESYIQDVSQEIDREYSIDLKKEREYQIKKQIKLLDWVSKKLFEALEKTDKERYIIDLQNQIIKTEEYKAKLMWLLTTKIEHSWDMADNLLNKFNVFENDWQEITK